ncbi:MAG TPA: sugar kinase [Lichenihabitans sp.]|jgi:2-dehydro-3-deoxygluconokinase|nr:sugar kinase [Lichenihabitans sp.]
MPDIIALGEPLIELNRPKGESHFVMGCGGDVSNAMVAAARQGASTGMATAVGADEFGEALLDLWRREGVDAGRVLTHPSAPTGLYFVSHSVAGHSFSYRREGSAASLYGLEDLPREAITAAKILHVSGISQAISTRAADGVFEALALARAAGVLLSYDTNIRLKLWPIARARAVIHEAMTNIDIALPGLDDARLLVGVEDPDAIADRYLGFGARIVALKLGSEGCLIATAQERRRFPPIRVDAVDATGAGDTFDGAFLAEYLATADPFRAGLYANVAAALSTRGYGAVDPMPHRPEVMQALARLGLDPDPAA